MGQFVRPQVRPISNGLNAGVSTEFGEDGDGEEWHEWVTNTTWLALIDERGQVGRQRLETEGKRKISGQWHGKGICGRVHTTPFLDDVIRYQYHTKERCSCFIHLFSLCDFAHALGLPQERKDQEAALLEHQANLQ